MHVHMHSHAGKAEEEPDKGFIKRLDAPEFPEFRYIVIVATCEMRWWFGKLADWFNWAREFLCAFGASGGE
jgi:hypothetical protein